MLIDKLRDAIAGRGHELAEALGAQKKWGSFVCPRIENHKSGRKNTNLWIYPKTGKFICKSTKCGIEGSLIKLAEELGHADPWGAVVDATGILLDDDEKLHLENLKKNGVKF